MTSTTSVLVLKGLKTIPNVPNHLIFNPCLPPRIYKQTEMTDTVIQDNFRRIQAAKSRFPGHFDYGYTHGLGDKTRKTNIVTNEFLNVYRQKEATEWSPMYLSEHPKPIEITCHPIHYNHIGHIPNYGGHIPGAQFRYGRTFGQDTIDVKRWFRGDHRPN